jgi:hypothetical protein
MISEWLLILGISYEVLAGSSRTVVVVVVVVTALVKDERGGQGQTSASLITPHCEHALFLQKCIFDFIFWFVCNGW